MQAGREQREYQDVDRKYEIVRVTDPRQERSDCDGGECGDQATATRWPHQRAVLRHGGCRRRGRSAAEQPVGLDREDDRHHHELGNQCELREGDDDATQFDLTQADANRLDEADQERGDEGARNRAEAADDGDDERFGDDRQVHSEIGRLAWQLQRAGKPCEQRAEEENAGEQPRLIDAQCLHHHPILGRSTNQRAPARAPGEPPQREQDYRSDPDQQRVILRQDLAGDVDRALEARSARSQQIRGAPQRKREVLDDEHDPEGRDQLQQFRRVVDATQEQDLDQRADRANRESCGEHRKPIGR